MATKSQLITQLILKGSTDPSLKQAFNAANKLADNSINKLKQYGTTAKNVAKKAGLLLGTGLTLAAKSAIDYESAFAGVMKTVDETGTTTYADLSKGILELSKKMPESANEIAGVAEAAGQLGIKADDVLKFSETMVKLGTTTNLSSEEAASTVAKLFNITGTSMDQVDRFGATLVHLGNNAATTEADILNMASRIAAGGVQIGLSESQILALATTLSSVGLAAEGGGTAISTVMANIDKAVATNGETLGTWAKTAGMSTSEFKKAWQSDAYGALQKVVGGMGDASKGGTNLNVLLEELGIKGIRTSDTMKRLTNASSLMGKMTGLANKAWTDNNALNKEASVRYATMASKLQMAKNKITAMAIEVGNKLMPYMDKALAKLDEIDLNAVADKIGKGIDFVAKHFGAIKNGLVVLGVAFAAFKVGSFIKTMYDAGQAIKGVYGAVKESSTFMKLGEMFSKMGIGAKLAAAGQWLLNASLFGCPVIWIIGAIAGLVAIFVVLWKKCDWFRNFWIGLWEKIKSGASSAGSWLKNFFTVTIPNAFNACMNFLKSLPSKFMTFIQSVGTAIVNFFKELPYKIGYLIGFCIGKVILFGQKLWNFATTTIPQFISKVINWFKQLPSRIWTWLCNTTSKIKAWGSNMISVGKTKAVQFINAVINFFKQLPSKVWTWLCNTAKKVVTWGSDLDSKGKSAAVKLVNAIVNTIKNLPSKMLSLGKNIVKGLWNGISNAKDWLIGRVKSFGSGIVDGIKGALGINSPSTVMRDMVGKFIPSGIAVGIQKKAKVAVNAVKGMGSKLTSTASKINPTIATKVASIKGKLPKHGDGGTFDKPHPAIVGDRPETIVPHGNTPRNRGLLLEAMKGVGLSSGGSPIINITFAPVINGGGDAEDNRRMLQEEEAEFERKIEAYFAKKGRLAF